MQLAQSALGSSVSGHSNPIDLNAGGMASALAYFQPFGLVARPGGGSRPNCRRGPGMPQRADLVCSDELGRDPRLGEEGIGLAADPGHGGEREVLEGLASSERTTSCG